MQSRGEIYTQVSLDLTNIQEALELAKSAVNAGIDWLEAGTPLILAEGLNAIRVLRNAFARHPIVADLKTMDGAGLEAEMMLNNGANYVVIMSQAHWSSIVEMVKVAHKLGGKVMADILNAPNKVKAAIEMEKLGVDWIIVHTGYDERRYVKNVSPLLDLPEVLEKVNIPVQAVGGLTIEQSIESVKLGASSLVIGAPLTIQPNKFALSDEFEDILKDVVSRVKEFVR